MNECRFYGECVLTEEYMVVCDGCGVIRGTWPDFRDVACEDYEPMPDGDMLLETLSQMDAAVRWAGPDVERDVVGAWADDIREALGEAANGVSAGLRPPGRREGSEPQAGAPSERPRPGARAEKNLLYGERGARH